MSCTARSRPRNSYEFGWRAQSWAGRSGIPVTTFNTTRELDDIRSESVVLQWVSSTDPAVRRARLRVQCSSGSDPAARCGLGCRIPHRSASAFVELHRGVLGSRLIGLWYSLSRAFADWRVPSEDRRNAGHGVRLVQQGRRGYRSIRFAAVTRARDRINRGTPCRAVHFRRGR